MEYKALSLRQPYANLIRDGFKTIETRTWTTPYRGDLLICAAQAGNIEPRGVALCVVELYNIRPMVSADSEAACVEVYPGAQAWLLRGLRVLNDPIPIKGKLGIFSVEIASGLEFA